MCITIEENVWSGAKQTGMTRSWYDWELAQNETNEEKSYNNIDDTDWNHDKLTDNQNESSNNGYNQISQNKASCSTTKRQLKINDSGDDTIVKNNENDGKLTDKINELGKMIKTTFELDSKI